MRIYMDVCCINRPFDDQTDERIRLESEAVLSILKRCLFEWTLISSEAIDYEISKTPDVERRRKAERIMSISREKIIVDETIAARALEIERFGLRAIDALHISIAERSADVLLTTDDEIIRAAINKSKNFNIRIMNPVRWLVDVL
jgi:hypothetical protein